MRLRSFAVCSLIGIIACDAVTPEPQVPTTVAITPDSVTIFAGDTVRLTAAVLDAKGSVIGGAKVQWSSADPAHVAVDSTGLLTLVLGPSNAEAPAVSVTINASYQALTGHVRVDAPYRPDLGLYPTTNVLYAGMKRQLTARLISRARFDTITDITAASWKTSNASVVTVANGAITAVGAGQAEITASVSDGRTAKATVTVLPKLSQPLRFAAVSGGATLVIRTIDEFYDSRSCGLTADGDVYCWGAAAPWMSGTDTCQRMGRTVQSTLKLLGWKCSEVPQLMPSAVKFASIVLRNDVGCGLAVGTGRVHCWGSNKSGTLGLGSTDTTTHGVAPINSTDSFISVQLNDLGTVACGLRADRAAFCWGASYGSTPVAIGGAVAFQEIAESADCGIGVDKMVYCFTNGSAQAVGGSGPWTSITVGPCALDTTGTPYCNLRNTPTAVAGSPSLTRLVAYIPNATSVPRFQSCGLTSSGELYCLGSPATKISTGFAVKSMSGLCFIAADDLAYCHRYDVVARGFSLGKIPGQE